MGMRFFTAWKFVVFNTSFKVAWSTSSFLLLLGTVFCFVLFSEGLLACMLVLVSNFKLACFSQSDYTDTTGQRSSIHTHSYTGGRDYPAQCHLLINNYLHACTHTLMTKHHWQFGFQYLAQGQFNCSATGAPTLSSKLSISSQLSRYLSKDCLQSSILYIIPADALEEVGRKVLATNDIAVRQPQLRVLEMLTPYCWTVIDCALTAL